MAVSSKRVGSPEEFAKEAIAYTGSDKRYITSPAKASGFSLKGADKSSAIGYIKFTDKSVDSTDALFRIEQGLGGKYKYMMTKFGTGTKYSSEMVPVHSSIASAKSGNLCGYGSTGNDNDQLCTVGYVSPDNGSNDFGWSEGLFVGLRPNKIKELYNKGHNKNFVPGVDYCPCVVIGNEMHNADKVGYYSASNATNDYHKLGVFGKESEMYIYAFCQEGENLYGYVSISYETYWQKTNTPAAVRALPGTHESSTETITGWVNLTSVIYSNTLALHVYKLPPMKNVVNPETGEVVQVPVRRMMAMRAAPASKFKLASLFAPAKKPIAATPKTGIFAGISSAISGAVNAIKNLLGANKSNAQTSNIYAINNSSNIANNESPYVSIHSITGLPFNFLSNTDIRYGWINTGGNDKSRTGYGKDFIENIINDMPIAVLRAGFPDRSSFLSKMKDSVKGIITGFAKGANGDFMNLIYEFVNTDYERFYSFSNQYNEYIAYVNTLCHMFATFIGIADKECALMSGRPNTTYAHYDDTITKLDGGDNIFTKQFGTAPAIFCYYQPDSQLSQTFSTETAQSNVASKVTEYSDKMKQWSFFGQALGIDVSENSLLGGVFEDIAKQLSGTFLGIIGEGAGGILMGSQMSLPEIWSDSNTEVSHEFKVKLVSPYGDPESVFLYVLRPLARLLALALPRQGGGPNTYTSPFVIQAFSKGQFNCQLGIVSSLAIERGGNGGESHTIHHLPTEINVTISIQDMYEKIFMSNEYRGTTGGNLGSLLKSFSLGEHKRILGLLFNNIGLMDFVASYAGYNLNSPSTEVQVQFMTNFLKNRVENQITIKDGGWFFPAFERGLIDDYMNTVQKANSLTRG